MLLTQKYLLLFPVKRSQKVMVFGTFDILHPGHLSYLKQAKKLGQHLVVVVARDKIVEKVKGAKPRNSERVRMSAIQHVPFLDREDRVILGQLRDMYALIRREQPDVIALGYDQNAFTKELPAKLKEFKLKTKIVRLKPYYPHKYKTSLIAGSLSHVPTS